MQITLDTTKGIYQINSYEPGKIIINKETITTNIIIAPAKLIAPWPVLSLKEITTESLQPIFALQPEVVLIGTGNTQQFLHTKLIAAFYTKQIGLEVMNTAAACRTYNVLLAEGRRVAAALFLQ